MTFKPNKVLQMIGSFFIIIGLVLVLIGAVLFTTYASLKKHSIQTNTVIEEIILKDEYRKGRRLIKWSLKEKLIK